MTGNRIINIRRAINRNDFAIEQKYQTGSLSYIYLSGFSTLNQISDYLAS